jgi:hypothetical protein
MVVSAFFTVMEPMAEAIVFRAVLPAMNAGVREGGVRERTELD